MGIEVRYPGRICLLGEHNDWAGGASLAVPMPLGLRVCCEEAGAGLWVSAELSGELLAERFPAAGRVEARGGPLRFVAAAAAALAARGIGPRPARLSIDADLPAGRGFSSSAASCLAVLDALSRHSGVVLPPEELAELAWQVEHGLLGVACGRLDPLCCAVAEPLWIRWLPDGAGGFRPRLRRLPARGRFHLVAACFARPRDTGGILRTLHEAWTGDLRDALAAERARRVFTALDRFGALTHEGAHALVAGDPPALGRCMDEAQQAYDEELHDGFSELRAPAVRRACEELRAHGALGAKFTGAGGDGSIVALFADEADARAAVDLLEAQGHRAWYCPFGEAD